MDLEARFFDENGTGNGIFKLCVITNSATDIYTVPVIAIFTKFDDLVKQVYDKNLDMAANRQAALDALECKFQMPLTKFKFPPKAYLRLESAFSELFSVCRSFEQTNFRNAKGRR